MICATCGHENRLTAKFCEACAAMLKRVCTSCCFELRATAKFCDECGTPAGAPASPGRIDAPPERDPRTYTPKHLADRILQSRSALEGERKQVTVLFADVKGSMELAEQLDPEEWHRVLERFFAILTEGVHRFEGTVNQYTGDGIMALFGAPLAHEDHCQRACYAALAMRDALRNFAREIKRQHGFDFATRIGINSGDVVVGRIGDDLRMDYTAQGHTVGLAQRMESLATGGGIYVSANTAVLAQGYLAMDDLGEFTLKGVNEPMHVFEVTGMGSARSRFDVSRARGLSRFVGREAETQTLAGALERTRGGEGQVIGIVADAGTGKSRLCFEFVERARAEGARVLEGHCVAHGRHLPLLPVLEVIRAYFGIEPADDERRVREKIAGRLLLLDETFRTELPILFDFLGVPDSARPAPQMSPEVRQRLLFTVLQRLIQGSPGSPREVTLILFEDLHWIDAASEAWIGEWVNAVRAGPTLLVLNFRPEYRADWMTRAHYQQLPLAPLTAEAITVLIADLIGSHPSTRGLAARIHAHTAGNPFFAEEVVQSLVESGQLTGSRGGSTLQRSIEQLEVPPTVQALLAARIDRLDEQAKRALQSASVIGKEFPLSLLTAVVDVPQRELEAALSRLRDGEFIQERSLYPVVEYQFKHPLTQAVAQASLLSDRRRALHATVARAIEVTHADQGESSPLLAHHWDAAGDAERAAHWHQRAAEWIAGNDVNECARHWQRVRELAGAIEDPGIAGAFRTRACQMLLEFGWRQGIEAEHADALLREGEAGAQACGDSRALAYLYSAYATAVVLVLAWTARGLEFANKGLQLARTFDDEPLLFNLELRTGLLHHYSGDLPAARQSLDAAATRSAGAMAASSSLLGYDPGCFLPGERGYLAQMEGRTNDALTLLAQGIDLARQRGEQEVLGWLLGYATFACLDAGDLASARRHAQECLEVAQRVDNSQNYAHAYWAMSLVLERAGETDAAAGFAEQWLQVATQVSGFVVPWARSVLAELRGQQGDYIAAMALAQQALVDADNRSPLMGRVWALLALARITFGRGVDVHLSVSEFDQVADWLQQVERAIEITGYRARLPEVYALQRELESRRGGH